MRLPSPIHVAASAVETIGVDLGGTKLAVGVCDRSAAILYRRTERSSGRSQGELVELLLGSLAAAIRARPAVAAIGLGVPCTIDRGAGQIISAVNLDLADLSLRELVADRFGLAVSLDNDGNLAALAEHRVGAARGATDSVMLTIGTGIGGGLVLGGEVYRGASGAAAELGHMVIDLDGPPCQGHCQNNGCLEALASGTAIGQAGRLAAERDRESALGTALAAGREIDGTVVSGCARAGDAAAIAVLAEIGRRLGAGLSGLVNIFEPNVIVIGGGAIAAGELLLGPARAEMQRRALPPQNRTPVVAAALGPDAGMIGAAIAAADLFAASQAAH